MITDSQRKKLARKKIRKRFGKTASRSKTLRLYQRKLQIGDMLWLAEEYQRSLDSEPSLTLDDFAVQHGVSSDELRPYLPQTVEGNCSIIVWHGTTMSRSRSIMEEGFITVERKKRVFFTRNPAVARKYARSRASRENDHPAVIMCSIDLAEYSCHERLNNDDEAIVFKYPYISSDVIKRVTNFAKQNRDKPEKLKKNNVFLP